MILRSGSNNVCFGTKRARLKKLERETIRPTEFLATPHYRLTSKGNGCPRKHDQPQFRLDWVLQPHTTATCWESEGAENHSFLCNQPGHVIGQVFQSPKNPADPEVELLWISTFAAARFTVLPASLYRCHNDAGSSHPARINALAS